jgi:hypothetical protein
MAILAGLLAAVYASWSAILRASHTARNAAAETQRARVAVLTIEEALAAAQMSKVQSPLYAFVADTTEEYGYLSFVSRLPSSFARSGRFGELKIRRVELLVEPDRQGVPTLWLRQTPFLVQEDRDELENPLMLVRNVRMFHLEYWGANSPEWMEKWPWTNQLPQLVRFTLAAAAPGKKTVDRHSVISRVVMLPAAGWLGGSSGFTPPLLPGELPQPGVVP